MTLFSPGVEVDVINQSFYSTPQPGTVPLIIVASAENKQNSTNTGIASGTLKANAGKVWNISSQRDLVDIFGDPVFNVDANNNPINGSELNEYGLQAAYSYLGVSNSVYMVRADVDLNQLKASSTEPAGAPTNNTVWLNTANSYYGIFEWNAAPITAGGQVFVNKIPTVVLDLPVAANGDINYQTFGSAGDYAVLPVDNILTYYYKAAYVSAMSSTSTWVEIGSSEWVSSIPIASGTPRDPDSAVISGYTLSVAVTYNDGTPLNTYDITYTGNSYAEIANNITNLGGPVAAYSTPGGVFQFFATSNTVASVELSDDTNATLYNLGMVSAISTTSVSAYAPSLYVSTHTDVPQWKSTTAVQHPTGSLWVKTTTPNKGASFSVQVYDSASETWNSVSAPIYKSNSDALSTMDTSGGGLNIVPGTFYVQCNVKENEPKKTELAEFRLMKRTASGVTKIKSVAIGVSTLSGINSSPSFTLAVSMPGVSEPSEYTISFSGATGVASDAQLVVDAIVSQSIPNLSAIVDSSDNSIVISHLKGGEIRLADSEIQAQNLIHKLAFSAVGGSNVYNPTGNSVIAYNEVTIASNWSPISTANHYYITNVQPENIAVDGQLWYNSITDEVDIMVNNGSTWVGYKTYYPETDAAGPTISSTQPTKQQNGASLVTNDLWIDTSDLENYPVINRYDAQLEAWTTIDNTDHVSENGIIFKDMRAGTSIGSTTTAPSGTIVSLLTSAFTDPDAPSSSMWPQGLLAWNTRRSGFNVKEFKRNYVSTSGAYPHRWVTKSTNAADGSGVFGHNAQRKVIVDSLNSTITANQAIRDTDLIRYNLIATPGYPEAIDSMVVLNQGRGLTAFVIGDTPSTLTPDITSLTSWGSNSLNQAGTNSKGLAAKDEYLGVFYPWGYTTDNNRNAIVVPPSHMMLRTFALNDQVAFPWYAPAGTRRGNVTNASAVGYIDANGVFTAVSLNEPQRDALFNVNINPITYFSASGLVNFGQKTRAATASALDRINVARLVIYLRSKLDTISKPYIFEPNDATTRNHLKSQIESLLMEIASYRGIYDFIVVCDESNNTPTRIDNNQLYVDIAIEPTKSVEFIYIPLRLDNTGAIAALGKQ